ncbi:hypothetical protein [Bradyrhizobium australiense]|nr:hypothetical protein [Bradyrhizobium australiense]
MRQRLLALSNGIVLALQQLVPPHDVIHPAAIPLACPGNSPYLKPMVQRISTHHGMMAATRPQGRVASMIVSGAASLGMLAMLGAAALWFHYGTTVFFEMIAAGISACF